MPDPAGGGSRAWEAYADDPRPGWASRSGRLFDVDPAGLADDRRCEVAICSAPFDSTASSRIGSRHGPAAIRDASLGYASQAQSRGECVLRHMGTGRLVRTVRPDVRDFGDLHVYPSDPSRQVDAMTAEVRRVASLADRTVVLGGEHLISYPAFAGVRAAFEERRRGRLGYVQIDHHFDFGNVSSLHGPLYHGSNARRLSELPGMTTAAMAFVGVGDYTLASQLDGLVEAGASVMSMATIARVGYADCLADACQRVLAHADALYVSIDIDVCDSATAPGTGHVTMGGLTAAQFVESAAVLRRFPVAALDVVEVNPTFDRSGATAHLAARLLFEWLYFADVDQPERTG
jgi:arginase family enzyme